MDDSKTVLARPFPLSTTDEKVKTLFEQFIGRVQKVKLRRDDNQAFRGSVYVEFESPAIAQAAVTTPPLRPNSKTEPLEVILKSDYNNQKQQSHARQGGSAFQSHKRPRHGTEQQQQQHQGSGLPPPPPRPQQPDMDLEQELMAYASGEPAPAASRSHVAPRPHQHQQPTRPSGAGGAGSAVSAAQLAEALRRAQEAEQALTVQREQNSAMLTKLLTSQAEAMDAQSREVAASKKLLANQAEIGSLKGEVGAAKSVASARLESMQGQYKARIHDLEVQVHNLKDDNNILKRERDQADARIRVLERKLKAAGATGGEHASAAVKAEPLGGGVKAEPNGKASKAAVGSADGDDY